MRQELLRIWMSQPWSWSAEGPTGILTVGSCWLFLLFIAGHTLFLVMSGRRAAVKDPLGWVGRGIVLLVLSLLFKTGMIPATLPIFGYGMMVLTGFLCGLWFSQARARAVGRNPEEMLDLSFWLLIGGMLGGRIAFLVQYWDAVVKPGMRPEQVLLAVVNLSEGGLVLIGALVGGALGFLGFCKFRKVSFLELADLVAPAVFIGIGFGRLGCLLNGCCFGERCDLPWAITFPAESVPFKILALRGLVEPNASATFPLHPTQIYSAIDGFILATVTALYYWRRQRAGDVFALGCILYSITRFLVEFLRGDEPGQLGTIFTISQFYSVGIMACGIAVMVAARWKPQGQAETPPRPRGMDVGIRETSPSH